MDNTIHPIWFPKGADVYVLSLFQLLFLKLKRKEMRIFKYHSRIVLVLISHFKAYEAKTYALTFLHINSRLLSVDYVFKSSRTLRER